MGKLGAPKDLSGYDQASQEPVRSSQGHSGTVRYTSGQYEYVLVYSGTLFSFVNISAPYNSTKLVLYLKFTYGSQFSEEKNGLISRKPRNRFLNCFFLLKTEIHMKILNIVPFLYKFRG